MTTKTASELYTSDIMKVRYTDVYDSKDKGLHRDLRFAFEIFDNGAYKYGYVLGLRSYRDKRRECTMISFGFQKESYKTDFSGKPMFEREAESGSVDHIVYDRILHLSENPLKMMQYVADALEQDFNRYHAAKDLYVAAGIDEFMHLIGHHDESDKASMQDFLRHRDEAEEVEVYTLIFDLVMKFLRGVPKIAQKALEESKVQQDSSGLLHKAQ